MTEHRYHVDGISGAPPEVVFDVLADGPGWADWAPGVQESDYEVEGEIDRHGVGAVRRFGAGRGPRSRERVVAHDRPWSFAYELLESPLPLEGYRAEVRLAPGPGGVGTRIDWSGRFESSVPGIGLVLQALVTGFARGLVAESQRRAAESAVVAVPPRSG